MELGKWSFLFFMCLVYNLTSVSSKWKFTVFYYSITNLQKQRASQLERTKLTGDIGRQQKLEKIVDDSFCGYKKKQSFGA